MAGGDGDPGRAFEFKQNSDSVPFLVLAGASLAFYALIGFEDSVNIAEEAQDTRRAYPRAIFGGLPIGARSGAVGREPAADPPGGPLASGG